MAAPIRSDPERPSPFFDHDSEFLSAAYLLLLGIAQRSSADEPLYTAEADEALVDEAA
jgi:hypothetical protein